jgi:uncharacterized membrane protein YfcA
MHPCNNRYSNNRFFFKLYFQVIIIIFLFFRQQQSTHIKASQKELICHDEKVTGKEAGNGFGSGGFMATILKFFVGALAFIAIPIFLLQMVLFPIKILLGLKTLAMANTVLLGTLLWRYINLQNMLNPTGTPPIRTNAESLTFDDDDDISDSTKLDQGEEEDEEFRKFIKYIKKKNKMGF